MLTVLTYTVPRSCTERDISVRMAPQHILWQKSVGVKYLGLRKRFGVAMEHVCEDESCSPGWYGVVGCEQMLQR
jgi:hypothetical protein